MGEEKYARRNTVLIVDDTQLNRRLLSEMMCSEYNILEAVDGEMACHMIEEHEQEIAIVLLDLVMPKMDGFEVLERMNERKWIEHIPVIMITSETSDEMVNRASTLGAIDYITKPFNYTIVRIRVQSTIQLYEKQRALIRELETYASDSKEIHPMTGLLKRDSFFEEASKYIKDHQGPFAILAVDVEHFKLLNESFGRNRGNDLLRSMSEQLRILSKDYDALVGYFGGDDFCILMSQNEKNIKYVENRLITNAKDFLPGSGILPVIGVYNLASEDENLENAYDLACIAVNQNLGNYKNRMCFYTPHMLEEMKYENVQLGNALEGLRKEEFVFYIQPHCDTQTGKIVGGEALARWKHDDKIVPPIEFIPVMEKKSVISELDLFVWEHVCIWIRKWVDAGHEPIPISINVSRVDLYSLDVPEIMKNLIKVFRLDPKWLIIEITESTYAQDFSVVEEAITSLRAMGFKIWMDDFGSGYSSLNMLSRVDVDAIKLDMKFLENVSDNQKGTNVLESVINMAKMIKIPLVVEGVESPEHIEYLRKRNCNFSQGYYFYKPMPVEEFETLIQDTSNILYGYDRARLEMARDDAIHLELTERQIQEALLKSVTSLYILDVKDNLILSVKVSDEVRRRVGYSAIHWDEDAMQFLAGMIAEEDRKNIVQLLERQHVKRMFSTSDKSVQITYKMVDHNCRVMKVYPLEKDEEQNTLVGILIVEDLTDLREQLEKES